MALIIKNRRNHIFLLGGNSQDKGMCTSRSNSISNHYLKVYKSFFCIHLFILRIYAIMILHFLKCKSWEVPFGANLFQIGTSLEICQELVIYYNGTIKQWKELSKEGKTGPLTRRKIICTDGELGQLKPSHPSTKWMCIDGNTVVMCVTGASGEIVLPD